jgi:transcription elongation factor GreA
MSDQVILTKEGRKKLEAELKRLKYEERPRIVAEIKRTREMGDLSENAEYHAAKEAQEHLERRIGDLEFKLAKAQTVDVDDLPTDKAYLLCKVLVKDLEDGEEIEYTLAPPDETDVDNDVISVQSPIGKALLGKAEGEIVEIEVPAGIIKYEVKSISR